MWGRYPLCCIECPLPEHLSKHLFSSISLWVSWEALLSGLSLADLSWACHASAGELAEGWPLWDGLGRVTRLCFTSYSR